MGFDQRSGPSNYPRRGDGIDDDVAALAVPRLTPQEERLLAWRVRKEHDPDARRTLIERYLPLVIFIARRYRGCGLTFEDLVAEGSLGLIRAIDHRDPERNGFVGYAIDWIEQAIDLSLIANESIHISVKGGQMYRKVAPYLDRCAARGEQTDRDTIRQLAFQDRESWSRSSSGKEHVSAQDRTIAALERWYQGKRCVLDGEAYALETSLDTANGLAKLEDNDTSEVVLASIEALDVSDRDREILKYRLGLYGGEPWSRKQTGLAVGISHERVRQVEAKYLPEIRAFAAAQLGVTPATFGTSS